MSQTMGTNDMTETDSIYAFLQSEGLSYRETTLELATLITSYLRDGEGESLARARELCRSLERLLDLQ